MATTVTGIPRVSYQLDRIRGDTIVGVSRALYYVGEHIMAVSKEHYVPVLTGTLRSSGRVLPPRIVDGGIRVTLAYGGAAAPYAAAVHERPPWVGSGKNKYLTRALYEVLPHVPELIRQYQKVLG